jgi:hypothetical protein
MLWFTYYKGTFSTFVFASQNRAFMLRSVLRTLRPSRQLTQNKQRREKHTKNRRRLCVLCVFFAPLREKWGRGGFSCNAQTLIILLSFLQKRLLIKIYQDS